MSQLKIAKFSADITPPIGHSLCAGLVPRADGISDPIYAKGIVITGCEEPLVLVAVDYTGISGETYQIWRKCLAKAAGTSIERVLVSTIHQHDAPYMDIEAERQFAANGLPGIVMDIAEHEKTVANVAKALGDSLSNAVPLTHVGAGEAVVEKVASNRRILGDDGKIALIRYSSCAKDDPAYNEPEGLIDPYIKTISFWSDDVPVAAVHCYATHPMSSYAKKMVSADFVGIARNKREADDPRVMQIYFNGCGGNLTAGKYNDGSDESRIVLADRIYQGMVKAWEATEKHAVDSFIFRNSSIDFSKVTDFSREEEYKTKVSDTHAEFYPRWLGAVGLSWLAILKTGYIVDVPSIDFGFAKIVQLPGEAFIEYQLAAQAMCPDSMVMTLGYGEYGVMYLTTDKAFAEGGCEPPESFATPGIESLVKQALADALGCGEL